MFRSPPDPTYWRLLWASWLWTRPFQPRFLFLHEKAFVCQCLHNGSGAPWVSEEEGLALQYFSSRILIVILCLVSCKPVTPPKKRNVWNILLYFKISQPTKYKKNKTKYIFEYSVVKWKHNGLVKVNIGYINWVKVKLQVGHSPNCLNFLLCHALLVFCGQFWGDATYFALSQNLS